MKHSKVIKPNQVSEPEVEYVKEISRKKATRKHGSKTTKLKPAKDTTDVGTRLWTDDDPFMLDELFGIWKNRKGSLKKIREKQWGKRS